MSEAYAVGAVAQRVGVATPTLRTWERRYGLGPSARTSGGHRRYSREDVTRIASMHRLITAGITPQAAAAAVLAGAVNGTVADDVTDPVGAPRPAIERRVRGLVRAARDFDAIRLEEDLSACVQQLGVVQSWTDVVVPTLLLVGERWESGQLGVESEHLASASVARVLSSYGSVGEAPTGPARILLACAEDETHALPLVAVQAALLERGLRAHMLGAAVPKSSLAAAVRRTGPRAVFLWSSRAETGDLEAYRHLPARRWPVRVVLGGPGWDRAAAAADAPRVCVVDSLASAVSALTQLAGPGSDRQMWSG